MTQCVTHGWSNAESQRLRPAVERISTRVHTCLLHLGQAALRPLTDGLQQGLQGPPKRDQRVLYFGRDDRVDFSLARPFVSNCLRVALGVVAVAGLTIFVLSLRLREPKADTATEGLIC